MDVPAVRPPTAVRTKRNGKKGLFLRNEKNLFLYVVFYLIFSPDTWRILIGLLAALLIGPRVVADGSYSPAGQVVIWLMILALGYVLSAPIGRFISNGLLARSPPPGPSLGNHNSADHAARLKSHISTLNLERPGHACF